MLSNNNKNNNIYNKFNNSKFNSKIISSTKGNMFKEKQKEIKKKL